MLNVDVGGIKNKDSVKGWKTLDKSKSADYVHNLNFDMPFPFKFGEVDYFYCSHTLEHVKPPMVQFVMNEFYRCLKKRGLVRIVVPNMEQAILWYINDPGKLRKKKGVPTKPKYYPDTHLGRLLAWFYTEKSGHYMGFDWELLNHYLRTAGFQQITRFDYGNHSKVFNGKDKQRYQFTSLFVEARK